MRYRQVLLCGVALALSLGLVGAHAEVPSAPAAWRTRIMALGAEHFGSPAWGYSHSQRDYGLARRLAAADHVSLDDDVLFAAAQLHDMAAFAPWRDEKQDHSDVAADLVGAILAETDFPMAKLEAVRAAVRTHMYYRDPVGPEARYLHDADALDWLGAVGAARMIALADPKGGAPTGPATIKMIEKNLAAVPSRVVTPAGQALVAGRVAETQAFLAQLRGETDDLATF
ncbi:HD domain-containing protein [Phenylobacterium aquaticum]|uniref:HD domain-containing protein n=1 Tax=Phenylobacterium aquaticum TaxID=1763816 RepID=UPI0026F2267A|nr:HD domain-containing protein [Phenylobacterium aquaticum]